MVKEQLPVKKMCEIAIGTPQQEVFENILTAVAYRRHLFNTVIDGKHIASVSRLSLYDTGYPVKSTRIQSIVTIKNQTPAISSLTDSRITGSINSTVTVKIYRNDMGMISRISCEQLTCIVQGTIIYHYLFDFEV